MKSLTPINRSIRLIALLLSLSTLAACSSTNSDGSTEGPEGGNTAPANKSDKLCGNQAADDKDQRCSEKPDKFGLAFVVAGATIPGTDPFSCSKDVCLSKANPPADTSLENKGGALLKGLGDLPNPHIDLASKFTKQLTEPSGTKLVFEFDGIDPSNPKIAADTPFKIYVWSYDGTGNKVRRGIIDDKFSSKSFFPNAKIDKNGYLTTGEGTLIFPTVSSTYGVDTFIYVEKARLYAKVDPNNINKLENAVIDGNILKSSILDMIFQVETQCPATCIEVCDKEGKNQGDQPCSNKESCTPGGTIVPCSGSGVRSFCSIAFSVCGKESATLDAFGAFTQPSSSGDENAEAPSVVEINTTQRFTIEESQFQ